MRKLLVLLLVLTLGCGSDGDPSGPVKVVTFAQLNGNWTFTLSIKQPCSTSAQGDVVATLDFIGSGGTGNTVSTWSNDPADPGRYNLIGHVLESDGETELRFWQSVLVRGFMVTGTFSSNGTFGGIGVDPIPGYQRYLSTAGCNYDVSGLKG